MPEIFVPIYDSPRDCECARERLNFRFEHRGEMLQIECRILIYDVTHSTLRDSYAHPSPPFARIFVFRHGEAMARTPQGEVRLTPGTIWLLPPGMPFEITYEPRELIYFHLHLCDAAGFGVLNTFDKVAAWRDEALYRRCLEAWDSGSRLAAQGFLAAWLTEMLTAPKLDELAERSQRMREFAALFAYLETHPPALITQQELADLYGVTPGALSKRFARASGVGLKHFLQERLLLLAQEYLLGGCRPVAEIAGELGYRDIKYFYRFFRKNAGQTPAQFRKNSNQPNSTSSR